MPIYTYIYLHVFRSVSHIFRHKCTNIQPIYTLRYLATYIHKHVCICMYVSYAFYIHTNYAMLVFYSDYIYTPLLGDLHTCLYIHNLSVF